MPKLLTKIQLLSVPSNQRSPGKRCTSHPSRGHPFVNRDVCVCAVELRFKSISNPKASRPNQEPARQKSLDAGCFFFSSTKLGGVVFAF